MCLRIRDVLNTNQFSLCSWARFTTHHIYPTHSQIIPWILCLLVCFTLTTTHLNHIHLYISPIHYSLYPCLAEHVAPIWDRQGSRRVDLGCGCKWHAEHSTRYSTTSHLVFDAGVANPHHTVPAFTCSPLCSFTFSHHRSIHSATFARALATAASTTAQLRAEYFDN